MLSKEEIFPHLQHIFNASLVELFDGLNCAIEQTMDLDKEPEEAPIAKIECGSNQIEMTILIRIPMSVLALTYPVPDVLDIDEAILEDWIAEISNQLIGKVKATLVKHKCDVTIGLPTSYFGADMASLLPESSQISEYYYLIDNEPCESIVCLETFEDLIDFDTDPVEEEDPFGEGEFELF